MCVGRQVWIFKEDPFPGREESDKDVHCPSGRVPIITDESQQNLHCLWRKCLKLKTRILVNISPTEAKIHKIICILVPVIRP